MQSRQQRLKKKKSYKDLVLELTDTISGLSEKPSVITGLEEQREVFFRIGEINHNNKNYHRNKFIKG